MKKIPLLLLALCLAAVTAVGIKSESQSVKHFKLAFVSNNAANFWSFARAGCNAASQQLGNVDVDFRLVSSGGSAEQRQILQDLVTRGVDGITVSVDDPDNQTTFLNNIASQTLLICADSDAASSKRVCYIGTDNEKAGEAAGQMIKECLPNGGKVVLFVGHADAQNAVERAAGIKNALAGSNIQVVDTRTDDTDPVRAQQNASDILVSRPDVNCLVGLWSYNGPAILNAVTSAKKIGQVQIVAFDDEEDTLRGIASGAIYGTVVQNPFEFGKQAVTLMDEYLQGQTSVFGSGKIFIPTRDIKKDNVADYQAEQKKILGK